MGLQTDLGMSGNDFSWLATAFFIAYAVAEVPQGISLIFHPERDSADRSRVSPTKILHPASSRLQCVDLGHPTLLLRRCPELRRAASPTYPPRHHRSSRRYVLSRAKTV